MNENLTIAEIKKKKVELIQKLYDSDILVEIVNFANDTVIKIHSIHVSVIDVSSYGSKKEYTIGSVGIEHDPVRI